MIKVVRLGLLGGVEEVAGKMGGVKSWSIIKRLMSKLSVTKYK